MPTHERDGNDDANFYPVDGMRGNCKCGAYFHYISIEGDIECDECGRVWNVYVDHDLWEE